MDKSFTVYFFSKNDIILVKKGKRRDFYDKIFKIGRSPYERPRAKSEFFKDRAT